MRKEKPVQEACMCSCQLIPFLVNMQMMSNGARNSAYNIQKSERAITSTCHLMRVVGILALLSSFSFLGILLFGWNIQTFIGDVLRLDTFDQHCPKRRHSLRQPPKELFQHFCRNCDFGAGLEEDRRESQAADSWTTEKA